MVVQPVALLLVLFLTQLDCVFCGWPRCAQTISWHWPHVWMSSFEILPWVDFPGSFPGVYMWKGLWFFRSSISSLMAGGQTDFCPAASGPHRCRWLSFKTIQQRQFPGLGAEFPLSSVLCSLPSHVPQGFGHAAVVPYWDPVLEEAWLFCNSSSGPNSGVLL